VVMPPRAIDFYRGDAEAVMPPLGGSATCDY
jgi:hypothetical protein